MTSPPPRGQILVIVAFALIVLLGVGALVVDLGFSWMLRRQEQNAVDPAAIAAARHLENAAGQPAWDPSAARADACFVARHNGFFEDATDNSGCVPTNDSGAAQLQVVSPPTDGPYSGRPGFAQVRLTRTHTSFFARIFNRESATVSTAAVAANTSGDANSSSLIALGTECTGTDSGDSAISGGGSVNIYPASGVTDPGGYVQVNAECGTDLNDVCGGSSGALAISGTLSAPFTSTVGSCSGTPPVCNGTRSPCLDEGAVPLGDPLADLPEPWPTVALTAPACPDPTQPNSTADASPCTLSGGRSGTCPVVGASNVCTMDPGVYYAGWDVQSNVKVQLKPGMYVFAGFGVAIASGSSMETVTGVDGTGAPIDARVTIFSTDYTAGCIAGKPKFCAGDINLTGSGDLRLKATDSTTCRAVSPAICPWTGILLWQDGTTVRGAKDINIAGGTNLVLAGTIYAPESRVKVTGGNGTSGCGGSAPTVCLSIQIIAESFEVGGRAIVDMPYDPAGLYRLEQRGLVH